MSAPTETNIRNGLVVYVALECDRAMCGGAFGPLREPPNVQAFLDRARSRGWIIDEAGRTVCPEHRQREEAMDGVTAKYR